MEIYLNYENFTETKTAEVDQLLCSLKGNATFVLMNSTNVDTLVANQDSLNKKLLAAIETFRAELMAADCVFVPRGVAYAVRSEFVWMYRVSWPHVGRSVAEAECFDRDNLKGGSMMAGHSFTYDSDEEVFYAKIGTVMHFAGYVKYELISLLGEKLCQSGISSKDLLLIIKMIRIMNL